ncbi:MAG: hypothetical protein JWL82_332 [Parcubacteria group bacterium]|nr:hypothetical protein [Parcubacteria group bacterium]
MPPEYTLPTAPPSPAHRIVRIVAIVIAVLIVLAVGYFFFVLNYQPERAAAVRLWVSAHVHQLTDPKELKNVVYVLAPQDGGRIYTDANPGASATAWNVDRNRTISDYARADGAAAAILYTRTSKVFEVAKDMKPLVSSASFKRSIALSPDGTKIAYAEAKGNPGLPFSWQVVVLDSASGKELYRAPGFTVFFLNDGTVLRLTQQGVERTTVATKENAVLLKDASLSPVTRVAQSADRSLLALTDPKDGYTKVYGVSATGTTVEVKSQQSIPAGGSIAVSPQSVYWLSATTKGSELWHYPLTGGDGKMIRSSDVIVTKLVF